MGTVTDLFTRKLIPDTGGSSDDSVKEGMKDAGSAPDETSVESGAILLSSRIAVADCKDMREPHEPGLQQIQAANFIKLEDAGVDTRQFSTKARHFKEVLQTAAFNPDHLTAWLNRLRGKDYDLVALARMITDLDTDVVKTDPTYLRALMMAFSERFNVSNPEIL